MVKVVPVLTLILLILTARPAHPNKGNNDVAVARNAVVRISTTFFNYSHIDPWKQPSLHQSGGTGFIIEGNRILTNAHVVSQANTIRLQRPNQRTDYQARVVHIAHDCDMALLEVDDPEFFRDSVPLAIGPPPELNSPLVVIGFPIGGSRVSITRGIVSRIGMDAYSHSQIDWHKVIQVDAAINPGNSGGPALQNGKVIGIAFQVYTRGQNLGYLIPPEVINKFLIDIKDGKYDGYIDFGVLDMKTTNPVLQRALGLTDALMDPKSGIRYPDTGVLVYNVIPGSSAEGHILPGDVILSVNGRPISHTGDVELDGQMQSYSELIDNFGPGTPIHVQVWRDRKVVALTFPARRSSQFDFQRKNYDTPPEYYTFGGLMFQPVNADLHAAYSQQWASANRTEVLYRYSYFMFRGIFRETAIDIVLTRRLGDPINLHADEYVYGIVESVNGEAVRDFAQFVALTERHLASGQRYLVMRFRDKMAPLVIRTSDLTKATPRVLKKYGIARDRYLTGSGTREARSMR